MNPIPHFPVPTVRLIVSNASGQVLILRRSPSCCAGGRWSLPGGKVDYAETLLVAARRELREETGLECPAPLFLFYQDSLPLEPGGMHCINFYLECQAGGPVTLNEESTAHTFIGPPDLERYRLAFGHDAGLRRYWTQQPHPPD